MNQDEELDIIKHCGKPAHFDIDHYLDSVEQIICADEIVFALQMLDKVPGYYREFPVTRMQEIKRKVFRQLMSAIEYSKDPEEDAGFIEKYMGCKLEDMYRHQQHYPKGYIIMELAEKAKAAGFFLDIYELAPAHFWVPHGLKGQGYKFNYHYQNLNSQKPTIEIKNDNSGASKKVFICMETLEHLWNEDDIYHGFVKFDIEPEYLILSTPKHTLGGGLPNWDTRPLGHIRTYTKNEFLQWAVRSFPGYDFNLYDAPMMTLLGVRTNVQK